MTEQRTKAQVTKKKTKKLQDNTHPLSPLPHSVICYKSTPPPSPSPHLSHPPIICNNNIMDIQFLVQMRQSDKCVSVRNDEIFKWHLGSGAGLWVSILCLLQDTCHIYWFHLPEQLTRKKAKNPEIRFNSHLTRKKLKCGSENLFVSPKRDMALQKQLGVGSPGTQAVYF